MSLLRGLSLSFCIRDIIEGRVSADDVAELRTGTYIRNHDDLEEVIKDYQIRYWQRDPERAAELTREFFNEGLIVQPRVKGEVPPRSAKGHWEPYEVEL